MAQARKWIVTTSGERPISEVVTDLSKAGFSVRQTLTEIGVITGSSEGDVSKKIRAIKGVSDVSPETAVDIGPPDAPHTW